MSKLINTFDAVSLLNQWLFILVALPRLLCGQLTLRARLFRVDALKTQCGRCQLYIIYCVVRQTSEMYTFGLISTSIFANKLFKHVAPTNSSKMPCRMVPCETWELVKGEYCTVWRTSWFVEFSVS